MSLPRYGISHKRAQAVRNDLTPLLRRAEDARVLGVMAMDAWAAHPSPSNLATMRDYCRDSIAAWQAIDQHLTAVAIRIKGAKP